MKKAIRPQERDADSPDSGRRSLHIGSAMLRDGTRMRYGIRLVLPALWRARCLSRRMKAGLNGPRTTKDVSPLFGVAHGELRPRSATAEKTRDNLALRPVSD